MFNAIISCKRNFCEAAVRVSRSNLEDEVRGLQVHRVPVTQNGPVALGFIDLVAAGLDKSETVTLDANTIIGRDSS